MKKKLMEYFPDSCFMNQIWWRWEFDSEMPIAQGQNVLIRQNCEIKRRQFKYFLSKQGRGRA